jgi:hypothetical protein
MQIFTRNKHSLFHWFFKSITDSGLHKSSNDLTAQLTQHKSNWNLLFLFLAKDLIQYFVRLKRCSWCIYIRDGYVVGTVVLSVVDTVVFSVVDTVVLSVVGTVVLSVVDSVVRSVVDTVVLTAILEKVIYKNIINGIFCWQINMLWFY